VTEDSNLSELLTAAASSFRLELAERVSVIDALNELAGIAKKVEDSGWVLKTFEDLMDTADGEVSRARISSLFNAATRGMTR
jgi:hypothetical protein